MDLGRKCTLPHCSLGFDGEGVLLNAMLRIFTALVIISTCFSRLISGKVPTATLSSVNSDIICFFCNS